VERSALVLRQPEIREMLDMASCIDAIEAAFSSYSLGRAELPGVIHLNVPEHRGEIHIKAGHLHDRRYYATKFSSGFYEPEPVYDGLVVVFDATDGSLAALLVDHGYITDVRTGAAGGVAARHLAPAEIAKVAVIGTGVQARYQLDALARVRRFRDVRVWGRNPDHAEGCVRELSTRPELPQGCEFRVADTVERAVDDADVVVTCTASTEPLLRAEWLKAGSHLTALGSDGANKQELDVGILSRADLLVCDSVAQCAEIGELHHGIEAGVVGTADAIELGRITGGKEAGRTRPEQLTVCDLTGVGVQDVAAALLVLSRARERGLGEWIAV
jgi:ornithine cyclodeaminase